MNDLYKSAAQALIKNFRLIVIVTVLAGVLAVTKELLFPVPYKADTTLLVTGIEERGDTTKLMPAPLNPKAYEILLLSTSVVGKVLDTLKKEGAFGADTPPELPDFSANLEVKVEIVDETSRPVNYSPLVHLTAYGKTAPLASKIVDTWSTVAQTLAQRAATVRLSSPAMILAREKEGYKSTLEKTWEEMRKETSLWDLDVLKVDLNARVAMINDYVSKRVGIERQLEVAKSKLELVRGDITTTLRGSQTKYSDESVDLRGKMQAEMSLANLELMEYEMNKQQTLLMRLTEEQGDKERMIKGYEESLVTIRKSLETEKPVLELGRAPSETAYWIVGGASTKSLSDLKEKVMVTQEMNPIYLDLKKDENTTLSALSQKKAELESVKVQIAALNAQLLAAKDQYSQHKTAQGIISNNLDVADKLFTTLGAGEEITVFTIERSTLLEVKGAEVELSAIDRQLEQLKREKEELQQQIAEHTLVQTRLRVQTEVAKNIFDDVTSAESFMSAALAVAQGDSGKDKPVGLNRINTETYATEDKGLLGRKGRVLLTTVLAFLLICTFVYGKDDGAPRLRKWLVNLD